MSFKNSYAAAVTAAVAAVVFSAAFQPAEASFVYYFEQVGDNVVVHGSGSFNTDALGTPYLFPQSLTLPIVSPDGLFVGGTSVGAEGKGWSGGIDFGDPNEYSVVQGTQYLNEFYLGVVNGSSSGDWVGINFFLPEEGTPSGYSELTFDADYVSGSPLSNTATLLGVSNGDLGYSTTSTWATPVLERTYTIHNPVTNVPTGDTIQIFSVPEPSQMVFMAGAGAVLGAWRLRKLRRDRPAAGDATAG